MLRMPTLKSLSEQIAKEIRLNEKDISPRYLPNQQQIRGLSHVSLDILVREFEEWKQQGKLRKWHKTQAIFKNTLESINKDIQQHGYWSFWHYSLLCLITSFAHMELIKHNKHKTIDLSEQSTWYSPNWEVAVLSINYVAGRLYPEGLSRIHSLAQKQGADIKDVCNALMHYMKQLHSDD